MADLYLTPAEKYTAALGGFYYGDLPEPGTVYTQLIKDILDGSTPDKVPKNILARFIYSLYISDLGDPYPRYELAKLLYWKLHNITPTKSGSILTVTIDGKEDYMTINTDLSRLWYKVLFGSKTDVITEFPYIFNTMQNKLSDWELFGNTVQPGTPTPDNPVIPQGTGGRTGNLFDKGLLVDAKGIFLDGRVVDNTNRTCTVNAISVSDSSYVLSWVSDNVLTITATYNNGNLVNRVASLTSPTVIDTTGAAELRVAFYKTNVQITKNDVSNVMLNSGSTALPYEPYGYKLDISSANTTTPVYLGEVETTRKIKKLVLDGTENFSNQYGTNLFSVVIQPLGKISFFNSYCTHYKYNPVQSGLNANTQNGEYALQVQSTQTLLAVKDVTYASPEDFKAYLAQQYAAGTPVTVWYVLATEKTGIVNEPLMKIGDYADSMSRAQTGIDIPTVIGQNTLDVLTTVKPSSMSIEYTSADENRSRSKRISLLKSPLKKGLIK